MTNKEAIKCIKKYMPKDNDTVSIMLRDALKQSIKALEQQNIGNWILPVNEKPDNERDVWVTTKDSYDKIEVMLGWYDINTDSWLSNKGDDINVIAWQESDVPEPYKKECN